jgi:aryl-alcohol dehydrogenase-like predicted oxidoreductase
MSGLSKRPLGRTGLEVTELGLGGVFISEKKTPRDEGVRVVQRALELGINYIDTAPFYGNSQQIIGEALQGRTESHILGTKCGRWDWKTGPYRDLDAFKRQFEQSLADLRRESVDILYIHEADWAVYWQDMDLPRQDCHVSLDRKYDYASAPVARFLLWAKGQRLTRFVGISGNNAHLLAKVLRQSDLPIDVVLAAFQYSLVWRNAKAHLLPLARQMGVGVVLGAPLQQGRLATVHPEWLDAGTIRPDWMDAELQDQYRDLCDICQRTGLCLAELGLRFLLADPDFATVIPGAKTVTELEQNVRAAQAGPLPAEVQAHLDRLGRVFPGLYR